MKDFVFPAKNKANNSSSLETARNRSDDNTLEFPALVGLAPVFRNRRPSDGVWMDTIDYVVQDGDLTRKSINLDENEDHLWEMLNSLRDIKGNLFNSITSETKSEPCSKNEDEKDIKRPNSDVSMPWDTNEKLNEAQDEYSSYKGMLICT